MRRLILIAIGLWIQSITCFGESANPLDWDAGTARYQNKCASCHGAAGIPVNDTFPKLAGQSSNYIKKELVDFGQTPVPLIVSPTGSSPSLTNAAQPKSTLSTPNAPQPKRFNPIMTPIAQSLSDQDVANIVAYIKSFKASYGAVNPNLKAQGELLYRRGDLARKIPACSACHSPEGLGNNDGRIASLAGQNVGYVTAQLQAFAKNDRHNDPNHMMHDIAVRLTPDEIQAVASYINGLRPSNIAK